MATEAHCAFCFETLAANLEGREGLSLDQVEQLWAKYHADAQDGGLPPPELELSPPTLGALSPASPADGSFRPAAISRLLANTPSSAGSSSVQSASSSPSLGASSASSATSKSSSRSSLLSPGRSEDEGRKKQEKYPLFVTYNTVTRTGGKRLRGCIGTFEPQELEDGLSTYALTS